MRSYPDTDIYPMLFPCKLPPSPPPPSLTYFVRLGFLNSLTHVNYTVAGKACVKSFLGETLQIFLMLFRAVAEGESSHRGLPESGSRCETYQE